MDKRTMAVVLGVAVVMMGVWAMQVLAEDKAPASKPAAESKTWTGTAQRSGTQHRPWLMVDGKKYEMKAAEKAPASVKETLQKISDGDTSKYTVKGTETTGDRGATIVVESITKVEPAQK